MAGIIDAHHHLWRYNEAEYGWIGDAQQMLKRSFLPEDLARETGPLGIVGTVAVQARQSLEETRFLLQCAASSATIRGVVGWVPLADAGLAGILRTLRDEAKLKGVRHVVQDEPDDDFMLGADFNRGVSMLSETGLAYDILIHERHLPQAAAFARRHPGQQLVLDHLAKPKVAARELEPWRSNLMRLADCGHVSCKISGLVTEADWSGWTADDLEPYLETALEAFGAERLMAASDWPVCLVATTYRRWWTMLFEWSRRLGPAGQQAFLGGHADRFYKLDGAADAAHGSERDAAAGVTASADGSYANAE